MEMEAIDMDTMTPQQPLAPSDPLPLTKEQRTLIAQTLNDGVKLLLAYEARVVQLEGECQRLKDEARSWGFPLPEKPVADARRIELAEMLQNSRLYRDNKGVSMPTGFAGITWEDAQEIAALLREQS